MQPGRRGAPSAWLLKLLTEELGHHRRVEASRQLLQHGATMGEDGRGEGGGREGRCHRNERALPQIEATAGGGVGEEDAEDDGGVGAELRREGSKAGKVDETALEAVGCGRPREENEEREDRIGEPGAEVAGAVDGHGRTHHERSRERGHPERSGRRERVSLCGNGRVTQREPRAGRPLWERESGSGEAYAAPATWPRMARRPAEADEGF